MGLCFNNTPSAVVFNCQVVSMHLDSEKARFSPIGSPTVPTHPEFNSVLFTPANHCDFVIYQRD
jgi:hypothetical protein